MLNNFVWSLFQGYKDAKKESEVDRSFEQLNWSMDCWIGETSTPLLEVSDLNELLNKAKHKDHLNQILDHLYRHDATRVAPYKNIEKKIIEKIWEG
ncbi:hypothetical protein F4694_004398 [Bacillus niacini]|uniref:Uncharacterized protein n=1 Tax=Neobacillus niacini TaxID=86668 RepID=A0A852TJ42_9BACI|nr:hypothetical protein [Neobacillus niacini]NYE07587.1 hypothetical protein [Neobacillus niacini]